MDAAGSEAETLEVTMQRTTDVKSAVAAVCAMSTASAAWQGEEGRSDLLGLALADAGGTAVWLQADLLTEPAVARAVEGLTLSAHRAKELMRGLSVLGIDFDNLHIDTSIAAYLIDPAM